MANLLPPRLTQKDAVHQDRPAFQSGDGVTTFPPPEMPAVVSQRGHVPAVDEGVGDDLVIPAVGAPVDRDVLERHGTVC